MVRKKIYNTEDEKRQAQRKLQAEYYLRNKESIKKKARDRYRLKKSKEIRERRNKELYGE